MFQSKLHLVEREVPRGGVVESDLEADLEVLELVRLQPDLPLGPHDLLRRRQVRQIPQEDLFLAVKSVRLRVDSRDLIRAFGLVGMQMVGLEP